MLAKPWFYDPLAAITLTFLFFRRGKPTILEWNMSGYKVLISQEARKDHQYGCSVEAVSMYRYIATWPQGQGHWN